MESGGGDLQSAALLASWPTPNTPSGGRSTSIDRMDATGRTVDGRKHTASLEHAVKFASWATPRAEDSESTGAHRGTPDTLTSQARLGSWATPQAEDCKQRGTNLEVVKRREAKGKQTCNLESQALPVGPMPSSSPAETGKPARLALNPRFSLWLMGYPTVWARCAAQVTRLSRRSPQK